MRVLIWEQIRKEQRNWAAFNLALLKAVDPRLVFHRPRDPEKRRVMAELGIEQMIPDVEHRRVRTCRTSGSAGDEPDECGQDDSPGK